MLIIRDEQMKAFEQAAVRNFEQRLVEHLKTSFPKHTDILGEEKIRAVVHYGWERAKMYGLIGENGIILFTDLMFLLGRGFDSDPQLPWAAEILTNDEVSDAPTRVQMLYDKAIEYLNHASGAKNEYIDAAQARIRSEKPDDFAGSAPSTLPEELLVRLQKIFPEKFSYVGEKPLRIMIQQGIEAANKYGISNTRGIAIYVGLMYMLGASFDTDPQVSWAGEILRDTSIKDQKTKIDQLYGSSMNYLSLWCAE